MSEPTRPELAELAAEECYRLLATHEIGRLGVNAEHYPLIFPVNYALDRDVIIIRTHPGTKLSAAGHANVTFEVDEIDRRTRSGWSVLVRGLAEEVTSAHRAEQSSAPGRAGCSRGRRGSTDDGCASSRRGSADAGSFRGSCHRRSDRGATCDWAARHPRRDPAVAAPPRRWGVHGAALHKGSTVLRRPASGTNDPLSRDTSRCRPRRRRAKVVYGGPR
jgi:hypothetical protein